VEIGGFCLRICKLKFGALQFHWRSFLFESCVRTVVHYRTNGRTSAASNFHIKASRVWTRKMVVHTVVLMHAISISDARVSVRESTSSGRLQQSSHICVWKEILKLDRTLRVVRMGCWIVRTDASWSSSKLLDTKECPGGNPLRPDQWCFSLMWVRTIWHVLRTASALDNWESGRDDTSSGRLTGNRIFLTCKLCIIFWNTSE